MRRATLPGAVALALVACGAAARAQAPTLTLASRGRAGVITDAGSTVSTVFAVANGGPAAVTVTPRIAAPAGWSVVMGRTPFVLARRGSDTWIVSIAVPVRAPAGRFVVPVVALVDGGVAAHDSLVVAVRERHALALMLVDAPPYVIAGHPYHTNFLLRNRGNGTARVRLSARTARGTVPLLDALSLTLGPDSSRTVGVAVPTRTAGRGTADDVLELRVVEVGDSATRAVASARVTIVPKPGGGGELVTVPAALSLRAAGPGTGVAPFELSGAGRLDPAGPTEVSFLARGPTGSSSPFGEHDEYRLAVRAPTFRARLGDDLYGYSSLAASGELGTGAGGEMARGPVVAGAYAERFRFDHLAEGSSESGAMLALRPGGLAGQSQLSLGALERSGGLMPGQLLTSNLQLHSLDAIGVDAEYAVSRGAAGAGSAARLRLDGRGPVEYDIGHTMASLDFAGTARGSSHDYAMVSAPLAAGFQVSASASAHETSAALTPFDSLGTPVAARLRTASVGLAHSGGLSVAYAVASRRDIVPTAGMDGSQRGIAARGQGALGPVRLWGSTELGTMHDLLEERDRRFADLELGGSMDLGANSVSLYGQWYDGSSVTRGPLPMRLVGGSMLLHLTATTSLTLLGSGSMSRAAAGAYTLVDARLSQALPMGGTISLRARLAGGGANLLGRGRLVFLEYTLPLRVPVAPLRAPGRVEGRIVNGETGRGVAGALVRLGSQAAVTDDDGRVYFGGVPAGRYRVSLAQNMTLASSAVDGDANVLVDSTRRDPATFRLAVARAAIVEGEIRRRRVAKTGVNGQPDSIADAGPLRDAVVALTSGRDTLYRTTDDSGHYRFVELSARRWTLSVVSEPPENTRFDPPSVALVLVPGQLARVDFRATPRHRQVHMIDSDDTPLTLPPTRAPDEDRHHTGTSGRGAGSRY